MRSRGRLFFFVSLVVAAAVFRLVPHPANVAPITALALFSGVQLRSKKALIVPIAAMMLSDLFLGFHPTIVWVYGSFILITLIGMGVASKATVRNITVTSLCSSFLFFVVSNVGVFVSTSMYSKDVVGLMQCFIAALPFYRNTLIGDGLFTGVLFGGYALYQRLKFGWLVMQDTAGHPLYKL